MRQNILITKVKMINLQQIELTLLSMGYRKLSNKWAKPVGYHLWIFDVLNLKFENYFKSKNGELHVYNSQYVEAPNEEVFLCNLKYIEAYSRHDVEVSSSAQFQFIDNDKLYETLL